MKLFLIRRISTSISDFNIGGVQPCCTVIGYWIEKREWKQCVQFLSELNSSPFRLRPGFIWALRARFYCEIKSTKFIHALSTSYLSQKPCTLKIFRTRILLITIMMMMYVVCRMPLYRSFSGFAADGVFFLFTIFRFSHFYCGNNIVPRVTK